jgi:hypothetical protein
MTAQWQLPKLSNLISGAQKHFQLSARLTHGDGHECICYKNNSYPKSHRCRSGGKKRGVAAMEGCCMKTVH